MKPGTKKPKPVKASPHETGPAPVVTEMVAVAELVRRGALFVFGDSGGKDSQAMRLRASKIIPASQILVVHATLGEVEWEGALEHARDGAARAGLAFLVAGAKKTFLSMVEHRRRKYPNVPSFPQARTRQCTSDLKRDPIVREVRRYAKARGVSLIVSCMGLRAEESGPRRRRKPLTRSKRYSTGGREWWEWLPVHHLTRDEVFATIREAGELPHPAYEQNDRLSCVFCIMGSQNDARHGAVRRPDLFERYVRLEQTTGYTLHQSKIPLEEFAGITVVEAREAHRHLPVLGAGGTAR